VHHLCRVSWQRWDTLYLQLFTVFYCLPQSDRDSRAPASCLNHSTLHARPSACHSLGICFFFCRCPCFSVCHSRRESASSFAVALAFLSVIPAGNLVLLLSLPLLFCLSFPQGICFCFCRCPCFSVCHSRRESAFHTPHFTLTLAFPPIPHNSQNRIAKFVTTKNRHTHFIADRTGPASARSNHALETGLDPQENASRHPRTDLLIIRNLDFCPPINCASFIKPHRRFTCLQIRATVPYSAVLSVPFCE